MTGRDEQRRNRLGDHVAVKRAAGLTLCDLPVTVIPVGLTLQGLPVGVQIIGAPGADAATLATAAVLEALAGGFRAPPAFGERGTAFAQAR